MATSLPSRQWATRVPGQPLFLQDLNCHCFDPRVTIVLNPNAWADTPSGPFSPSAAYDNDFRYRRRPSELASFGRARQGAHCGSGPGGNNIFNRTLFLNTTAGTYVNPSILRNAAIVRAPDARYTSVFGTINTSESCRHIGGAQPVLTCWVNRFRNS